jgi:hypothetical protein
MLLFGILLLKFQEGLIGQNLSILFIWELKLPYKPQISVWRESLRIVESLAYKGKPYRGVRQEFDEGFKVVSGL